MRAVRAMFIGVLVAGGLTVLAPSATASTAAASKACTSLQSLNQKLEKALKSADTGKVDTGAAGDVSSSFRKAVKSSPGSLKSAMNTIASVGDDVSHTGSTAAALAVLKSAGAKFTGAVVTWGAYVAKHCPA
jgi:hypothetical protein